jgi:uncharacterized integral membrane protein
MSDMGIYHQPMRAGSRIVIAAALAVAAAFIGGFIGSNVPRILVEHFGVVEGPPAGVLLVLLVATGILLGGVLGFVLSFRWLRTRSANPQ